MTLVKEIKQFLKSKFKELKLTRKDFSEQSGIPYNSITNIMNELKSSPKMYNIFKIAHYFKCSMDEVVGRNQYVSLPNTKSPEFFEIIPTDITFNIKKFLIDKTKEHNLNLYKLGMDIGFSSGSLHSFVNKEQKTLNSQIVVALADYFQVSLDEIIGRIKPTTSDNDKPSL
ncbi:helix-turn-helix transcriptional regulator [Candidatus Tisiphia endosymbiont of Hybos culiciformis]|uniref:helix-turn-helix transcriptional regulator n=1 Tax=Candidatus Tisiphia endosymbiont of Hybos culiciformis TaxID=3139331 RepID=UPI003CCB3588